MRYKTPFHSLHNNGIIVCSSRFGVAVADYRYLGTRSDIVPRNEFVLFLPFCDFNVVPSEFFNFIPLEKIIRNVMKVKQYKHTVRRREKRPHMSDV